MSKSGRQDDFGLLRYADLGIRLALFAGLFTYGGYLLDAWLDTAPWMLLLFSLLGFSAGMWSVIAAVKRMSGGKGGGEAR